MDSTDRLHRPYMVPRRGDSALNVLTMFLLAAALCAAGFFTLVYPKITPVQNPPPAGEPQANALFPTSPEPTQVRVTEQPGPPAATDVIEPVLLPVGETVEPTAATAPTPLPDEPSDPAFELRGDPVAVDSQILRPDEGCEWTGVAGEAIDLQGSPVTGLFVRVGGTIDGKSIDLTGMTGTVITYGPAGYEIYLLDHPAVSQQTLWIQLFDQAGLPLSRRILFDTKAECEQNLVLLNFKQVR